jgi:drug/metabolite transporter (DMT)-like permease
VEKRALLLTYGLIFFVMVSWGLNVVMLKLLVESFPPQTMTAFRILTAGIVTILIVLFGSSFKSLSKREWNYTLLGMVFGVVLHHTFLAQGLTMIDASNAVLILALLPLTTALFAVFFLGEALTKWRLLGICFALIGVFLIQGGIGSFQMEKGEVYLFIAMIVQAISFIFIKKTTATLDSKQVTAMMLLFGSIGLLLVSLVVEPAGVGSMMGASPFIYIVFFFSAIVATAVGHFVFNAAIQKIGAGQTAIFNNFVPFFGLVFSAIFLKETIYLYQLVGFLFIVAGVLFGTGYAEKHWVRKVPIQEKSM